MIEDILKKHPGPWTREVAYDGEFTGPGDDPQGGLGEAYGTGEIIDSNGNRVMFCEHEDLSRVLTLLPLLVEAVNLAIVFKHSPKWDERCEMVIGGVNKALAGDEAVHHGWLSDSVNLQMLRTHMREVDCRIERSLSLIEKGNIEEAVKQLRQAISSPIKKEERGIQHLY